MEKVKIQDGTGRTITILDRVNDFDDQKLAALLYALHDYQYSHNHRKALQTMVSRHGLDYTLNVLKAMRQNTINHARLDVKELARDGCDGGECLEAMKVKLAEIAAELVYVKSLHGSKV